MLPTTWSETEHVRWKTPIHGKGWSSPVIWGDQIWLTTATEDGKQMSAIQIDRDSGKIVRDLLVFTPAEPQFCHPFNSYASCTPAIEEGRVYIHFGSYGTTAIDTATGKRLWTRDDLPCDHFRGPGSSPIIWHDLLMLTFDGFDFNYVVALNKNTGETVWRKRSQHPIRHRRRRLSQSLRHAHGPQGRRTRAAGQSQPGATIAYDPASGHELWRVRSGGMNAAARPLLDDGLIFCTSGYSGFQLFAVRPDGEGDITDSKSSGNSAKAFPAAARRCWSASGCSWWATRRGHRASTPRTAK